MKDETSNEYRSLESDNNTKAFSKATHPSVETSSLWAVMTNSLAD